MKRKELVALAVLVLIALWLRAPFVGTGLPFFYQEDEAHHFNRVVDMVKTGSYNPGYFHKPSLHFYLRMPVVAASFLWGVKEGHLRRLEDIKTHDPFGLAKYAFTASHEGIVKWNRGFSLIFSLILVCLTYLIAAEILGRDHILLNTAATLPVAISPDLILYSSVIGVDIIMSTLCAASVLCALRLARDYSMLRLVMCGLLAGLAVSTKYNALPVAIVPVAAVLMSGHASLPAVLSAVLTPVAGFFIGSPFTLVSLPLFLNQFAYEIWHYGVEGHEGHMAPPGIPQLLFYLSWMGKSALGIANLALAIAGLLLLAVRKERLSKIFLVFPVLFGFLMCEQKVNFERNLLAILPFMSVAAGATLLAILQKTRRDLLMPALFTAMILCSLQPSVRAVEVRHEAKNTVESRKELKRWIEEYSREHPGSKIGVAGQLQMPPYSSAEGIRIDQQKTDHIQNESLAAIVVHGPFNPPPEFSLVKEIPGEARPPAGGPRIMRNPDIQIFVRK